MCGGPTNWSPCTSRPGPHPPVQSGSAPITYAQQFATRQRHRKVWVKAIALVLFAFVLVPAVWAIFSRDWRVRLFWLIPAALGLASLKMLLLYSKGSPYCPNCCLDITDCPAAFCHLCGEPLKGRVCNRCGADPSWTAGFQDLGLRQSILYCPACGVYLNTTFYRYERQND